MESLQSGKIKGLLPGETEYKPTILGTLFKYLIGLPILYLYLAPIIWFYHVAAWCLAIPDKSVFNENPVETRLQKIVGVVGGVVMFLFYRKIYFLIKGLF